ncbi:MAG TPA: EamA family transporter [Candidatus Nanoarchaeia archaeon]|nr:EamA family transporter [Candidatus Nanoarchaeia archaeon]
MNWFLIAFTSTVLWSVTNFIDKYLVSKYFQKRGLGVLMIFAASIGFFLLPIILLITRGQVFSLPPRDALILMASGIVYVFAILPYFFALRTEDASLVAPFFQSIPVFSYFLGLIFLGEHLSGRQIAASLLIIFGAVGLSIDFSQKSIFRWRIFGLMMLSSLLYALNIFFFKFMERDSNFWTTSFWEYAGFSLAAVGMLAISRYRREFMNSFKVNGLKVLGINSVNEIINIAAKIIFNFATLLAPLALVWTVNGMQPLVVLFFGFILTIFWPKIFNEDITKKTLAQKAIFIILIFIGGYLLNRY